MAMSMTQDQEGTFPFKEEYEELPEDWDEWEDYEPVEHKSTIKVFEVLAGEITRERSYKMILRDDKNLKQPLAITIHVCRDGRIECFSYNIEDFLQDEEFANEARAFFNEATVEQKPEQ
jgi:hypothetical protein